MNRPILYSFRRCPYAMRARLAIASAGIQCELREILLRDKAPEFLEASPKGTVPVVVDDGVVIDESYDVMFWALRQNDPEDWLSVSQSGLDLVAECDGSFKQALDRYKYPNKFGSNAEESRAQGSVFLDKLDSILAKNAHLGGERASLVDFAILPFIRQFANTDRAWFDDQDWPHLLRWLNDFLESDRFKSIMDKHPKWVSGDAVTVFP